MSDTPEQYTITPVITFERAARGAFPSLYEEAAVIENGPIKRVGRSATHPMLYFLFRSDGPSFYTINVQPVLEAAIGAIGRADIADAGKEDPSDG